MFARTKNGDTSMKTTLFCVMKFLNHYKVISFACEQLFKCLLSLKKIISQIYCIIDSKKHCTYWYLLVTIATCKILRTIYIDQQLYHYLTFFANKLLANSG